MFDVSKIKQIIFQLLKCVQICHTNWIMHLDIKPHNVFLDDNSNVILSDFGLSNVYNPVRNPANDTEVVTLWYRALNYYLIHHIMTQLLIFGYWLYYV